MHNFCLCCLVCVMKTLLRNFLVSLRQKSVNKYCKLTGTWKALLHFLPLTYQKFLNISSESAMTHSTVENRAPCPTLWYFMLIFLPSDWCLALFISLSLSYIVCRRGKLVKCKKYFAKFAGKMLKDSFVNGRKRGEAEWYLEKANEIMFPIVRKEIRSWRCYLFRLPNRFF